MVQISMAQVKVNRSQVIWYFNMVTCHWIIVVFTIILELIIGSIWYIWLKNWENSLTDKYLNFSVRINCWIQSSMRWSHKCSRSSLIIHEKMNLIACMQGEIRTDLLDIKSNMRFMMYLLLPWFLVPWMKCWTYL